jgi:fumarylacetoacetase
MDATHDPLKQSFISHPSDSHFPIQNLPFGVCEGPDGHAPRVCTIVGDQVVDLAVLEAEGLFDGPELAGRGVFGQASLNAFMALGRPAWREARARLSHLLDVETLTVQENKDLCARALLPLATVKPRLPVEIGDYTDFYSSREHATNVGTMFRGAENALQPNWLHLPVAYHGRASSIVPSGTAVRRPLGQTRDDPAAFPNLGPSRELDFELEVGAFIGPGNPLGEPIAAGAAWDHVFGLVLVNDWSARDIQRWEYVPLGPFLAKNFATTISPWVVTLDALEPFRVAGPAQRPDPLPYLAAEGENAVNIHLEVMLQSAGMRKTERFKDPHRVCATNFSGLYWSIPQQIAHHTIGGCNLRTGDLLASGTISGQTPDSRGSLLEISWQGTMPLRLPNGEERLFLEDGDRVVVTGWCQGPRYRVGFGEASGMVLPARDAGGR